MKHIDTLTESLIERLKERWAAGKVRPSFGTRGYLVLMNDKIERILADPQEINSDELREFALDAITALYLNVDWKTVEAQVEDVVEKLDETEDEPEERQVKPERRIRRHRKST